MYTLLTWICRCRLALWFCPLLLNYRFFIILVIELLFYYYSIIYSIGLITGLHHGFVLLKRHEIVPIEMIHADDILKRALTCDRISTGSFEDQQKAAEETRLAILPDVQIALRKVHTNPLLLEQD